MKIKLNEIFNILNDVLPLELNNYFDIDLHDERMKDFIADVFTDIQDNLEDE